VKVVTIRKKTSLIMVQKPKQSIHWNQVEIDVWAITPKKI
jgi:hypothetical protein